MSRRKVYDSTNQEYRAESIERLRAMFPAGSDVATVVKYVTGSGMGRVISVLGYQNNGRGRTGIVDVSHDVARVLDWRYDNDHRGVYVQGCGMDMAFHLVYTLSHVLYSDTASDPARAGYELNKVSV